MAYIDKLVEQQANVFEFRAESRLNRSAIEKKVSDYTEDIISMIRVED